MNSIRMIPVLTAVTMTMILATVSVAVQKVDEAFPLKSDGRFSISLPSGTVTVEGWDREQVEIGGTLNDEAELKLDTSPGHVSVKVEYPKAGLSGTRGRGRECSLTVRVPRAAAVDFEGVSAEMTARDVKGSVNAAAVSGGISVTGQPRDVEVKTVSGDVAIEGAGGTVRVTVVSGSIGVTMQGGEAWLQSVSGGIRLSGRTFDRVEASSVSGNVELEGGLAKDARMDINSHSGSVNVRLLGDVSARLSLSTFSGAIESAFGGDVEKEGRYTPSMTLDHTVGGGDGRVKINTFSGSIRLKN